MSEILMNSLESFAMNCGIVRDDPGPRFRVFLLRPLQDDFNIRLGHRLPDVPVHDVPAETVQDAAQVVAAAEGRSINA
jgi:hypothetical protein